MRTFRSKSLWEIEKELSRAYQTLDNTLARGSEALSNAVMNRIGKLEIRRDELYENARDLFGDEHDLAASGYDDAYVEGIVVEVIDYEDTNPTSEMKVNRNRHKITLDIEGIEVEVRISEWHDEPVSDIYPLGERWGFYCYIIPGKDNQLYYFTP